MSLALIDDLASATAGLRQAMERAELSGIELAMARFRTSLEAVQAVSEWRTDPQLKLRVGELMAELTSSRMLACLLGDTTGQMHAAVSAQNLDIPQPLYRPR